MNKTPYKEIEIHHGDNSHLTSIDLDMFCSKCGRMFIRAYIPYLITVALIIMIFYWHPIKQPMELLFLGFTYLLLLIVSVLRHRPMELIFSIPTMFPILLIYTIVQPIIEFPFKAYIDIILSISLFLQFISFLFTVVYGFLDAPKYSNYYDELHKGTFWIILAFMISLIMYIFELEIHFLISIIPENSYKAFLNKLLTAIQWLSTYRSYFVATVVGLVVIISTAKSLIKELKMPTYERSRIDVDENENVFSRVFKNIAKLFLDIFTAIVVGIQMSIQIMIIIARLIWKIIKDLVIRGLLIIFRFLRFAAITTLTIIFYTYYGKFAVFTDAIWETTSFHGVSIGEWKTGGLSLIFFVLSMFGILMFSYKKWNFFEPELVKVNQSFGLLFGKWDEMQLSGKSITLSIVMYMFYITLAFLGAWTFINAAQFLLSHNWDTVGILFVSMIGLIVILGAGRFLIYGNK